MANRTATLYVNVKMADGLWRFKRPVTKLNGRLKPGWALLDGKEIQFEDFNYYVSWYESGAKKFELVGRDTDVAVAAVSRREKGLEAKAAGLAVVDQKEAAGRLLVSDAIAVYLADAKTGKSAKTFSGRKRNMELFRESCNKTFMDQIDARDMLDLKTILKKQKFADRTVFNNFEGANSFLRANGIKGIVGKHDWPRFDEKPVKKYDAEQMTRLFKAADTFENVLFRFFVRSGGREGEVARLQWRDIDWKNKTVQFASREGASTKNRKSRTVPLPDDLVASLRDHQKTYGGGRYVFPNGQGGMEGHFLRILKTLAHRAGLNCGYCFGVGAGKKQNCKEDAVCGEFELHRLRKTFASDHLHNGAHVRQIQKWLGHHSLDVTLAFLADEDDTSEPVRDQVNSLPAYA
jgi:integrase